MKKNTRIFIGMAIFFFLAIFSFFYDGDDISWLLANKWNILAGLVLSFLAMVVIIKKSRNEEEETDELTLKQLDYLKEEEGIHSKNKK